MKTNILTQLKKIKPVAPTLGKVINILQMTDDERVENFILESCKELKRVEMEINSLTRKNEDKIQQG